MKNSTALMIGFGMLILCILFGVMVFHVEWYEVLYIGFITTYFDSPASEAGYVLTYAVLSILKYGLQIGVGISVLVILAVQFGGDGENDKESNKDSENKVTSEISIEQDVNDKRNL